MSIVLVTGSGKRLGRGLAIEFAKLGWDIIIHYNNSQESAAKTVEEIKSYGVHCISFGADIRQVSELEAGFENAVNEIGYPDVLVNNAAIYPELNHLDTTDYQLWNDVINTNLTGYFAMSKIFSANAKSGSHIINIASMGAFRIWKGRIPYNVSKAGVLQLTKALALDLAPNIAVNSVSPGSISIPDEPPTEELALKIDSIPMKRYGNINDVFEAVNFFASSSLYITGQNICIDGGYNL
jgi:NAD(P)-dependent dehydrogenase (short-subunit alcohol dehydrogenase family)